MAENVDGLVLAEIRQEPDGTEGKIDDLRVGQNGHTGMLMAPAGYVRGVEVRVERIEQRIGAGQ